MRRCFRTRLAKSVPEIPLTVTVDVYPGNDFRRARSSSSSRKIDPTTRSIVKVRCVFQQPRRPASSRHVSRTSRWTCRWAIKLSFRTLWFCARARTIQPLSIAATVIFTPAEVELGVRGGDEIHRAQRTRAGSADRQLRQFPDRLWVNSRPPRALSRRLRRM